MRIAFPADSASDALLRTCERYAELVAMLIVTKGAYADTFEKTDATAR